ncbi:carbohydrate-binding protein [Stigmatella aurantiaca]|uniref:Glycosyl hydrolases family 16 n=1 Tax=Stigmatella aurantiaca (strain DW4/3-1) TaxID=378806 RepID=Q099Y3_STIAD|nr:carbohydrate-binding protein [Stigmatella aurantiaca]ADO73055.1 Glycosyl hydrolases family 16 [Stigmatella aurantiaca DW4/3-1]EAU68537.1 glycosyl hydrolases family 16 [Stigmatella aurantiaca DW4/3-1]
MRRSRKAWSQALMHCGIWALGLGMVGCSSKKDPAPVPAVCQEAALESADTSKINVAGEPYTLTWGDDFGGTLNGGQPKSRLNANFWGKENLGVNYELQAYTNRECTDHPASWNYCVENGKLTLLARQEPLDCVVWQQCTATSQCGVNGTCSNGYCLNDQNQNGVWDHDECAPFNGLANAPVNGTKYTSGRLSSDEKVEFRYGYIEFRARMPFAELPAGTTPPNGMWPAIWLLGANNAITNGGREDTVGWPMNGEIDIMEYSQIKENPILYPLNEAMGLNTLWREYPEAGELAASPGGWQPNACSSWPNNGDAKCDDTVGGARATWAGQTIDYHQWHTWGFLWDENGFKIYIDDLPQNGGTPVGVFSIGDDATEFRQPMYLILNNAVGGELGCLGWSGRTCTSSAQCANNAACVNGKCDETPGSCLNIDWAAHGDKAKLEVDYVRWYHRDSGYAQAPQAACQNGDGTGSADNIIRNCGFNEDYTYHRSDLFFEGGQGISDIRNEGGAHGYVQWVRVDNGGWQGYSVQVRQEGFTLQGGTTYRWKVDLKASEAIPVPIKIVEAQAPWTVAAVFTCEVGTTWTTCAPPDFHLPSTNKYKFEIDLGNSGGVNYTGKQFYIDNMYLGTVAHACQPECTGKLCGEDGCGGTCGTCGQGTVCASWGQCAAPASGGPDGGTPDAGTPDAGTPDAGTPDAGTPDAGTGEATPVRLEAENATSLDCCEAEPGGDSGDKVVSFEGGDSLCWSNVNLSGLKTATAHVGAPHAHGQAQLEFNGTVIGTLALCAATGGWSSPHLTDISTAISASGTGTLCLTGVSHPEGSVFSVDYLDLK